MSFDFQQGRFTAVGVSAQWCAFEHLLFDSMSLPASKAAQFRAPAVYVGRRHSVHCIAVHPEAESGSIELEFALWRALAHALDEVLPFSAATGRHSTRLIWPLHAYAEREAQTEAQDEIRVFFDQRTTIPGSPSPHEPFEAILRGVTEIPERLGRLVAAELRALPGEAFAMAMAQMIACPRTFRQRHGSLADDLEEVLRDECGLLIRALP